MGTYTTVTWSPNDEVTSSKLQQMSDNDTWLKDNALIGRMVFPLNASLNKVAAGRSRGSVVGKRLEVIQYPFDSMTPTKEFEVRVPLQPVFTNAPIILVTPYSVFTRVSVRILRQGQNKYVDFRISEIDSLSRRLVGELNIMAFGV
jgi:hypothetical protein